MKKEFLDLGRQPIANKFLKKEEFSDEFFYDLKVVFDKDTKLVSLKEFVKPELMFNEDYVYHFRLISFEVYIRTSPDVYFLFLLFHNNVLLLVDLHLAH